MGASFSQRERAINRFFFLILKAGASEGGAGAGARMIPLAGRRGDSPIPPADNRWFDSGFSLKLQLLKGVTVKWPSRLLLKEI